MADISLAGVRAKYTELLAELFANQAAYAKRKAEIMVQYGDRAHYRNDVILDDLSSGAKTLSAMISALTDVLRAELAWRGWNERRPPGGHGREQTLVDLVERQPK